jgi:hypothetical protein
MGTAAALSNPGQIPGGPQRPINQAIDWSKGYKSPGPPIGAFPSDKATHPHQRLAQEQSVVVVGLRSAKLQLLGLALRELGVSFAQVLQQGEGVEEEGEEEEERRTQGRY